MCHFSLLFETSEGTQNIHAAVFLMCGPKFWHIASQCWHNGKLQDLVSWNKGFMNNIACAWQWSFSGLPFSLNIMLISCAAVPMAEKATILGVSTLQTSKESQCLEVPHIHPSCDVHCWLSPALPWHSQSSLKWQWATGMEGNWLLLCSWTAFWLSCPWISAHFPGHGVGH